MRGFTVVGPDSGGAAPRTCVTIVGGTTVRPRCFDVVFGSAVTPADQAALMIVSRFTAAGTSAASAPVPTPLDVADIAAIATNGWTHSAEPTYQTNDILRIPLNQRASFRWVASPGYEIMAPATSANGIGACRSTSTANYVVNATLSWFE